MQLNRRIMVSLPPDMWNRLKTIAQKQYRDPRKQLELIVHHALRAEGDSNGALHTLSTFVGEPMTTHVDESHPATIHNERKN